MSDAGMLEDFLASAGVDAAVFGLRPDYRAMLVAVDGLVPGPSDQDSDALLAAAETAARQALDGGPAEQLPHVAAWREAYRAFGAKPQRTRNSLEALLRRAASGLPRVSPARARRPGRPPPDSRRPGTRPGSLTHADPPVGQVS